MKKVLSVFIVVIIFLVGIKVGSSTSINKTEDLFESAKEEFEEQIVIPNNQYENIQLKPKEYLPNKIAKMIDKMIDKITSKIA